MLAPAAAAKTYQYPNSNAWRTILDRWAVELGVQLFDVPIATLDDPISSPYDQARGAGAGAQGCRRTA